MKVNFSFHLLGSTGSRDTAVQNSVTQEGRKFSLTYYYYFLNSCLTVFWFDPAFDTFLVYFKFIA